MFRKLLLSGILSVGAIAGLTTTPTSANAHERPIRHEHRHHERFQVMVLHGRCWDVHATFRNRWEAQREAARLLHCGEIVEIRPC